MTYPEILAHIYSLARFGIKPGLERISPLLGKLGNPHEWLRAVHVVGTNGKGSTAAFLSAIATAGGYRAGLFTSPHLIRFTERIRIDGAEITEDEVLDLAHRVLAAAPAGATFFEIVTAMALLHFAEQHVELAVLEAGMGGRLDATNSACGILTILTPVSLDHCDYLGASVSEIAREKVGIVKPNTPVVVSSQAPDIIEVVQTNCAAVSSPVYFYGRDFTTSWSGDRLAYSGIATILEGMKPGLPGVYQAENAGSALCAAELLNRQGFCLNDSALKVGLENARWPGRMEMIGEEPRVLLDGAHNAAGGRALAEALTGIPRRRLIMVAGVMGDKDAEGILAPLLSLADTVVTVSPGVERAMPSAELTSMCRHSGRRCLDGGRVEEGLKLARNLAEPDDLVLVCGSLFTVGEARALLLAQGFEPFRG